MWISATAEAGDIERGRTESYRVLDEGDIFLEVLFAFSRTITWSPDLGAGASKTYKRVLVQVNESIQ